MRKIYLFILSILCISSPTTHSVASLIDQLTAAIQAKNNHRAKALLNQDIDLNEANSKGITPLHAACTSGNEEIFTLLLTKNIDLDKPTTHAFNLEPEKSNLTARSWVINALGIASFYGRLMMVQKLIECGAKLEANFANGPTAFLVACQKGHLNVAQYLLEQFANPFAETSLNANALHMAAYNNNTDLIAWLLSLGISPDTGMIHLNAIPLEIAIKANCPQTAYALLEAAPYTILHCNNGWSPAAAAFFNVKTKMGRRLIEIAAKAGVDLRPLFNDPAYQVPLGSLSTDAIKSMNLLEYAICVAPNNAGTEPAYDLARYFISLGADPKCVPSGRPLMLSPVAQSSHADSPAFLQQLITLGADLIPLGNDALPIEIAAQAGRLNKVKIVYEAMKKNGIHYKALSKCMLCAAFCGNIELLEYLFQEFQLIANDPSLPAHIRIFAQPTYYLNVIDRSIKPITALLAAASHGHIAAMRWLYDRGAQVNMADAPLRLAAMLSPEANTFAVCLPWGMQVKQISNMLSFETSQKFTIHGCFTCNLCGKEFISSDNAHSITISYKKNRESRRLHAKGHVCSDTCLNALKQELR